MEELHNDFDSHSTIPPKEVAEASSKPIQPICGPTPEIDGCQYEVNFCLP